jgi:hypothetical protein
MTPMNRRRFLSGAALAVAGARLRVRGQSVGVSPIRFEDTAQKAGVHFVVENSPTPEKHQP